MTLTAHFLHAETNASNHGFVAEAQSLGSSWRESTWFGRFFVSSGSWIYHSSHGWLYPAGNLQAGGAGIWLWSQSLGWHWTSEDVYPFLYADTVKFSDPAPDSSDETSAVFGWLYYHLSSRDPRLFFNYATSEWVRF